MSWPSRSSCAAAPHCQAPARRSCADSMTARRARQNIKSQGNRARAYSSPSTAAGRPDGHHHALRSVLYYATRRRCDIEQPCQSKQKNAGRRLKKPRLWRRQYATRTPNRPILRSLANGERWATKPKSWGRLKCCCVTTLGGVQAANFCRPRSFLNSVSAQSAFGLLATVLAGALSPSSPLNQTLDPHVEAQPPATADRHPFRRCLVPLHLPQQRVGALPDLGAVSAGDNSTLASGRCATPNCHRIGSRTSGGRSRLKCAPFQHFARIICGTVFGAWDGQPTGNHAENQNTATATTQSHSACGNTCGPDASPCICGDHPLDESSALLAADPKRISVRNVSRPNSITE